MWASMDWSLSESMLHGSAKTFHVNSERPILGCPRNMLTSMYTVLNFGYFLKLWNFDLENNLSVIKSKVDTEKNIILDGYKKRVNHFEGALQLS